MKHVLLIVIFNFSSLDSLEPFFSIYPFFPSCRFDVSAPQKFYSQLRLSLICHHYFSTLVELVVKRNHLVDFDRAVLHKVGNVPVQSLFVELLLPTKLAERRSHEGLEAVLLQCAWLTLLNRGAARMASDPVPDLFVLLVKVR